MPIPAKLGTEFLVTTAIGEQRYPTIAAIADGRFVVAWEDWSETGDDTSGYAIRAQVFNSDGDRSGSEFLVNSTTFNNQADPTIAALSDGRFVVAWTDWSQTTDDTSSWAIRARIFNADSSQSGSEFLVYTDSNNSQFRSSGLSPTITGLTDGRFVVAWQDWSMTDGDASESAIRAQVFNADGSHSGTEILANSTTAGAQFYPAITALAGGRFVAAWNDDSATGGDTSGYSVRGQVFNADGSQSGAEFLVNSTAVDNQEYPTITALADGRFVVAWTDWSQEGGDTSGYAIRAQVFNADGTKSSGEFLVNSTTSSVQHFPTIASMADGRFVVSWMDWSETGSDTSGYAIRAQVFNSDGAQSGNEFLVNSTTAGDQLFPTISALGGGRFAIAWMDWSETGGDAVAIRAQIFDANAAPAGPWNFTPDDPDTLLFSHFALDAYNGGGPLRTSAIVRAPEGWAPILITTHDSGSPAFDIRTGNAINATFAPPLGLAHTMQATAYREEATGRVVIAYRGTNDDGELGTVSGPLGAGFLSTLPHLQAAVDFYRAVIDQGIDPSMVSFAGHSLGGMLAGYLAAITGSQAMLFASGPHTLIERDLHPQIILPAGYGFLTTAPDWSEVVQLRISGELLGDMVAAVKSGVVTAEALGIALATLPAPSGLNVAGTGLALLASLVNEAWGDADLGVLRENVLEELLPGNTSLSGGALHSMGLHSLMLYANSSLGLSDFKNVPGFLSTLFSGPVALHAAAAMGSSRYFGDPGDAANRLLTDLMLAVQDGRENVVEPLLRDAEQVLTRFMGLDFGPVLEGLAGPGNGFNDRTVPEALARHLVEMAARALLDDATTYTQAVGMTATGQVAPWISMNTGVATGITGILTQGVSDILSLLARIASLQGVVMPTPDVITVRSIEQSVLRSFEGTGANDLVLGARLDDGAGVDMSGGGGDDVLVGSLGADTLDGGSGFNLLLGGLGQDRYEASSAAGTRTMVVDTGGVDTLALDGLISGNGRSSFRYVADALTLGVGNGGASVDIVSYYGTSGGIGAGRIETIVDGNGQTWRPVTMIEQIGGRVVHAVNEAQADLASLVTTTVDAIDEIVLGPLEALQDRVIDVVGGGIEDFLRFSGISLTMPQINLRRGSLIVDVDENLDGVVDASIRFVGDFTGYGIEIVQDGADSLIRLAAAPEVLYDIFGTASLDDLNGTEQGDRMGGLEGDDLLNGLEGNDSLHGGGGDDWLDGGVGADHLFGGAGHDVYIVDDLRDLVIEFGGEGDDEVWAGISYALSNDVENLLLMGTASISGTGNALANRLTGNAGDNLLVGGGGNDSLDGDEGADTADYASETAAVRVAINGSSWAEVFVGGVAGGSLRNIETVIGGLGDDVLGGDALANGFVGGAGNDTFQGHAGMDSLDGGAGSDTASYAEKTAAVSVTLDGISLVEVLVGGVAEDLISNMENIVGGSGADRLTGDAAGNQFFGGGGHDILVGLAGADQSHGGDGNDYLYMGEGNDIASGNVGVDVLLLDTGDDYGYGGDDTDYIFGGLGNDILVGEGGVDVLQGEAGNDIFDGGAGGDYVYGGTGNDTAYGRDGNDIFVMEAGNDTAFGEEGQDYFYMGDGDDSGNGGAGVDVFLGGAGNDTFEGGTGVDYAWGEAGNDAFVIRGSSGVMVVNGFTTGGADDVVRLTADTGITTFARALASSTYYAGMNTTIVTVDADTAVWLVGVNRTQLTAADFAFV